MGVRAIDADRLKSEIGEIFTADFAKMLGDKLAQYMKVWVDIQPTVEAEVRHGYCVREIPGGFSLHRHCSVCNGPISAGLKTSKDGNGLVLDLPAYCPHCGAKMDMVVDDDATR